MEGSRGSSIWFLLRLSPLLTPFPLSQQGFVSNQPTEKAVRPDLTRGKGTEAPPAAGMRGRAFLLRVGFLGPLGLPQKERASSRSPHVRVSPSHTDVRARVTFLPPVPIWVLARFASLAGFRPALLSVSVPHTQSKKFEMPLGSLRPSSPSGPRGVKMHSRPAPRRGPRRT